MSKNTSSSYIELKDGIYYTIQGLVKKYGLSKSYISKKIALFKTPRQMILGVTFYKDDSRFARSEEASNHKRNTKGLEATKAMNYAELSYVVKQMCEKVDIIEQYTRQITQIVQRIETGNDKEEESEITTS